MRKSKKNVEEPDLDPEVQPRSSFLSDEGRKAEAKPTHFRVVLIFPAFSIPLTNLIRDEGDQADTTPFLGTDRLRLSLIKDYTRGDRGFITFLQGLQACKKGRTTASGSQEQDWWALWNMVRNGGWEQGKEEGRGDWIWRSWCKHVHSLGEKKKKKANSAIGCEHFVKLHSFSDNGPLIAASPGYPSSTRRACGHSFTCHFPK